MNKRFQGGGGRWAPWVAVILCGSAVAQAQTAAPPQVTAKPPLSWAGTTFDWGAQFSTRYLGIGPDHLETSDKNALMTWSLSPNYFFFWRPRHQLSFATHLSLAVGLTNAAEGSAQGEPLLGDIPLGLDYAGTLFTHGHGPTLGGVAAMRDPTLLGEGSFRTWVLVSTYFVLPASRASREAGLDLGTSIGVGLRQQITLLGGESGWLRYVLITVGERWTHAFGSYLGTFARGQRTADGVYDGGFGLTVSVKPDALRHSLALTLPIYRDLHVDATLAVQHAFPEGTDIGCDVKDPYCAAQKKANTMAHRSSIVAVAVSYAILPELGITLGCLSNSAQNGNDRGKRGLFYNPDPQIYTDLTLSIDRLVQRIEGPAAAGPTR